MSRAVYLVSMHHSEHINANLPLVKELVGRGEEIIFFLPDALKEKIEAAGAFVRSVMVEELPIKNEKEDLNATYGVEVLFNHARDSLYEATKMYERMYKKVAEEKPDYILHDSYTLWAKYIAKHMGIPAVCTVSSFAYSDRMIDEAPEMLMKNVLRMSENSIPSGYGKNALRVIIDALTKNLKKMYGIEDFMDVFSAKEKLNIVYSSEYFHICPQCFDEEYKFVGPSVEKKDRVLDIRTDKPLVYIYLREEFLNSEEILRKIFEAFRDSNGQIFLSVGSKTDRELLKSVPDNFSIVGKSQRLEIMERADVFITNEGFDIVNEVLYNYIPVIMLPYAADQSLLAYRIEELGAGIFINKKELSALELKDAAEKILSKQDYRENSKLIGDSFRRAGGYVRAADEIFKYKENIGIK